MTIITHRRTQSSGRSEDCGSVAVQRHLLWLSAKRTSTVATGRAARAKRRYCWPSANNFGTAPAMSGHLIALQSLLLLLLLTCNAHLASGHLCEIDKLATSCSPLSQQASGSAITSTSSQSNSSNSSRNDNNNNNNCCGPMKQQPGDMLRQHRQERQQLVAALLQATDDNATLASSSNVTAVRRHRRHVAQGNGLVQLQESRRKVAASSAHQVGSSSGSSSSLGQVGSQKRQVIQALLGGQATLECNIQSVDSDDAVSLVLWYKDKSMVPIYSLDARASHIQEARHKPGPWLEGRSSLKVYTQRLVVRNRRQTATLNEARLVSKQSQRNRRHKTHRTRRRSASLAASGSNSSPAAAATNRWLQMPPLSIARYESRPSIPKAASLLHNEQHEAQQLRAQLHMESLSSEDNGQYLCRVDFRKARSRTQEFVLKIIVPADKPTIRDLSAASTPDESPTNSGTDGGHASSSGSTQLVGPHSEGARVVLLCETQGGYPEPTLSWWRDGRLVDDSYEVVSALDGTLLARWSGGEPELGVAGERDESSETNSATQLYLQQLNEANEAEKANAPDGNASNNNNNNNDDDDAAAAAAPAMATAAAQVKQNANNGNQNRLIRNRLELNGLTRADLMANYSCQARNTKLSEPPSSSIMIDMNLRPLKVRIENERLPVLADKPLEVSCRADGSRPPAQISWWRNQVRLLPGDPSLRSHQRPQQQQQVVSSDHHQETQQQTLVDLQIQDQHTQANLEQSNSVLTFVPQIDDAGQTITCKAENTRLPDSSQYSIEDSWKLDVHYLPRVRLALGDKLADAPVREGHDVYFECTVRAAPAAHEVRWWFAGRELESNQAAGIIISNQSLVLQHVSRKQRGRYTCSAINSVGESHSNGVHLRVQFAPFCRDATTSGGANDEAPRAQSTSSNAPLPNAEGQQGTQFNAISQQRHKTHYGAARLEPVKVYCHVDADPVDQLTYKWAFVATTNAANDSQQVQQVSNTQQQQQRKPEFSGQQLVYLDSSLVSSLAPENPLVGVASYTPRSELDYGTLLCWASNVLGEQSEPCAYQVIPAERPDPVRNCRLLNASQVQLAVACEPGYDGGVEQSFQMEVYDSKRHELVANVTASSPAAVRSAAWWLTRDSSGSSDDDTPTGGSGGEASGLGSRLQKQRHSSTATAVAGAAAASTAPAGDLPEQVSSTSNGAQNPPQQYEAVLLTETNLEPNTDYLLSIYSANSKGVSKRVAFTATTANLTTTAERPVQVRDGRRLSDPSHLLGDVLSLSWHPFLLVCAVTLVLFIMFASITFAMMKYIDFSSGFNDGNNNNCNGSSRDKKSSLAKQVVSPMRDKTIVALRSSNDSNSLRSDSPRSDLQCEQRARVISLASSAGNNHQLNNSTTLSDKAHCDLPLNAAVKDKGSLLNGGYLRAKLHRLIGQPQHQQQVQCQTQKLKQSTSETYLNQLASVKSAVYLDRNQQQASFCGTLPRNHLSGNLRFQPSNSNQQQFIQLESSLNEQLYANKSLSSATNSETTNYSINTSLDSHHQQQQQSAAAQVANAILPAGNYLTPLGEQRVEQLVISGKQYIHQTSVGAGRLASVYLRQQQQQQQQQQSQVAQQRHHLQMTSAPYGSLQRANLYAATAMKDYHSQQQQTPLVFINQSAMMSSDQQQQQQQQQQISANSRTDFAALPVEECALFMNSDGSVATSAPTQPGNCVSSFTSATKTSDLGSDDSPPMFATTNTTTDAAAGLPGNTCHLAHLTLVDGASEVRNALAIVDSDGLSSGTQRSIGTTSNGSPSSGVAELDHNYLYLQQQVNGNSSTTANNQCCELVEHRILNGNELGSTDSTAVINLTSSRARRQQTGKLSGKTGIQQLPNSRNIVVHHQQQHQQPQSEAQQQLDSYTVFVDAHEFNLGSGSIGLETQTSQLTNTFVPAQTRVRLIGTSDLQQQQQQLTNGSTTTLTNDFCQNSSELQLQTEV